MRRNIFYTQTFWLAVLILLGGIFISFNDSLAVFTTPYANPPGGNRDAPVSLNDSLQVITGGLEVDAIGVTSGISIGGINRTAAQGWPAANGTASCYVSIRRVDLNSGDRSFFWDEGASLTQYPTCDDYLTSEAKNAGWASTGGDNCLGTDGYDCGSTHRPSTCMYMRLVCPSGIQVVPSVVSTSTYAGGLIQLPINSTSSKPL